LVFRNAIAFSANDTILTFRLLVGSGARNLALESGSCYDFRTGKVSLSVGATYTTFEVTVGSTDTDFARFEKTCAETNTRTATRGKSLSTGIEKNLLITLLLSSALFRERGGSNVEVDVRRNFGDDAASLLSSILEDLCSSGDI
jgi:hypothetical protein